MATKKELVESGIEKIINKVLKEESSFARYYQGELNRLTIDSEFLPTVKFTNGNGQGTKNLNLNNESIPIIIAWLKSIQKKLPRGGSPN